MNQKTYLNLAISVLLVVVWSTGCTLDNISGTAGRPSGEEDIQAATRILGESLSSDESGIILSLNDALTTVSDNAFLKGSNQPDSSVQKSDRSGRGDEINYSHTYQQQTGIHQVSFKRLVKDALFSKKVTEILNYQYRGSSGHSIQFPDQEQNQISSIYFNGHREGQISTLQKQSLFTRQDTLIINGINSPPLVINGVHHGSGTIEVTPVKESSFRRSYKLEINLLNISVPSTVFSSNQNIWQNVSGTLSWQLSLSKSGNSTNSKKLGGTIKLAGAGIALLNFRKSTKKFQVNLDNGDIKDQGSEFEGRVASINRSEQSVTLASGRKLYLTDSTIFDEEDYVSLQAVSEALAAGISIWAEGEGKVQNNRFIVSEIEFDGDEADDSDDNEENKIEFEESVSSADAEAGVFILANKVSVRVNSQTDIDDDGDYRTLRAVADALEKGILIKAEGEALQNNEQAATDLTAVEVEFKKINNDNNGSEED